MIVFGPSWLIESRSDWSKPRMSDVIPTIEVMPMTTPSTVSAERILLVRSVSNAMLTISPSRPERDGRPRYSRLNASIGSRRAARIAGYRPKNNPTIAVMPMPIATDQTWTAAGSGVSLLTMSARMKPKNVPTTPPNVDSVTDSVRICQMMSRRRAPSALRRPISRSAR